MVCRAGREAGSGNISTQYLFMIGLSARSVIHTFILMMLSGVPPAVSITRRTLANIAAHCASRSSGTVPLAGSAPEIAPETTNGPRRLALGIGLTCRAPATSMLRRFSIIASSRLPHRDDTARVAGPATCPHPGQRPPAGEGWGFEIAEISSGRDRDLPDHPSP